MNHIRMWREVFMTDAYLRRGMLTHYDSSAGRRLIGA